MTIEYDTPFEVTKEQYNILMNNFQGAIAGREDAGKFYIKVWIMHYASAISNFLNKKIV